MPVPNDAATIANRQFRWLVRLASDRRHGSASAVEVGAARQTQAEFNTLKAKALASV